MVDPPWYAPGALGLGIGSLLSQIVMGLRGARKAEGDLTLARLEAVVEAQGSWIKHQAEQIIALTTSADALTVRVVAAEVHARECDARVNRLDAFIRSQNLDPP